MLNTIKNIMGEVFLLLGGICIIIGSNLADKETVVDFYKDLFNSVGKTK